MAIGRSDDGNMADHLPFHAVFTRFQGTTTVALKQGASKVAQQAGSGGDL